MSFLTTPPHSEFCFANCHLYCLQFELNSVRKARYCCHQNGIKTNRTSPASFFLSYNMRWAQGNLVNSINASEPMQTVNMANKHVVLSWQYLLSKGKSQLWPIGLGRPPSSDVKVKVPQSEWKTLKLYTHDTGPVESPETLVTVPLAQQQGKKGRWKRQGSNAPGSC